MDSFLSTNYCGFDKNKEKVLFGMLQDLWFYSVFGMLESLNSNTDCPSCAGQDYDHHLLFGLEVYATVQGITLIHLQRDRDSVLAL